MYKRKHYCLFQSLFLVSNCIQMVSFNQVLGAKAWAGKRDLCGCHVPRLLREVQSSAPKFTTGIKFFSKFPEIKYLVLM